METRVFFVLLYIIVHTNNFFCRFNLSGKCSNGANKEELEEKRAHVYILRLLLYQLSILYMKRGLKCPCCMQVVAKLHAILRPFLLRRMKTDVELMLPRKKEIIIYAGMTEHQKSLQDHLVNETLGKYLNEKLSVGIISPTFFPL